MAEIIQNEGGKKGGKKRPPKHSTHIDMTPMVDLACLLLTFFMLTTAFSKPKVMEIVLPEKLTDEEKKTIEQPKVDDSKVVNIIMDNDRVFWYNGMADPNKPLPVLTLSDFSKDGLRKVLLKRNKDLFVRISEFNDSIVTGKLTLPKDSVDKVMRKYKRIDKLGPVVLIKAGENVKYGNIVDVIDEMAICNIARYAIVDINDLEKKMLETARAQIPADENVNNN